MRYFTALLFATAAFLIVSAALNEDRYRPEMRNYGEVQEEASSN